MSEINKTFRDHFLSIYQSAADDYARQVARAAPQNEAPFSARSSFLDGVDEAAELRSVNLNEVPFGPVPEAAVDVAKVCSALGLRYLEALVLGDKARASEIKAQMDNSTCDPKWLSTLDEYYKYFGPTGTRAKIPYVRAAKAGNHSISIKAGARVAIFGDWGTGGEPARRILNLIKEQKPDVLVHLGDIYYSGTKQECSTNFEKVIDEVFERKKTGVPVFTLAGNHDMYSGGKGYYGLIGRLNEPSYRQTASFFCLRSDDDAWQMLAMDTGLHDYSPLSVSNALTFVEEDEQAWLEERTREFPGKTILLSHHQLFSAFSQIGKPGSDGKLLPYNPNLLSLLRRLRRTGKQIPAWFWGHEHNLCIYKRYMDLDYGRCIGHGAIPVFLQQDPYVVLSNMVSPPQLVEDTKLALAENVYLHGFALVTLGNATTKTHVDYFQDGGKTTSEDF